MINTGELNALVDAAMVLVADRSRRLDQAAVYARRRWPGVKPDRHDPEVAALLAWINDGGPGPGGGGNGPQ